MFTVVTVKTDLINLFRKLLCNSCLLVVQRFIGTHSNHHITIIMREIRANLCVKIITNRTSYYTCHECSIRDYHRRKKWHTFYHTKLMKLHVFLNVVTTWLYLCTISRAQEFYDRYVEHILIYSSYFRPSFTRHVLLAMKNIKYNLT